jgi:hypothetical protein
MECMRDARECLKAAAPYYSPRLRAVAFAPPTSTDGTMDLDCIVKGSALPIHGSNRFVLCLCPFRLMSSPTLSPSLHLAHVGMFSHMVTTARRDRQHGRAIVATRGHQNGISPSVLRSGL